MSFLDNLYQKSIKKGIPVSASFELTSRCNFKCKHCYIPPKERQNSTHPSKRFFYNIFEIVRKKGCLWVLFTGGEPLIRKDFLDLYVAAKKKGFIIYIYTNGSLINKEHLNCWDKYTPFLIEVSLYGVTEETYFNVTGVRGAFKKVMQAAELMKRKKIPFTLKSLIMRDNCHELSMMRKIAKRFKARFYYSTMLTPRLDKDKTPLTYRLTPEEIVKIEKKDKKIKKTRQYLFSSIKREKPSNNALYKCSIGLSSFAIDSKGKFLLCPSLYHVNYDLRKGSFNEAWDIWRPKALERKAPRDYQCNNCSLSYACELCPPVAYLETESESGVCSFYCELAKLRNKEFSK